MQQDTSAAVSIGTTDLKMDDPNKTPPTPEEELGRIVGSFITDLVSSASFLAILQENLEESMASLQHKISATIGESLLEQIDCDEIAQNAIDNADVLGALTTDVEERLSGILCNF